MTASIQKLAEFAAGTAPGDLPARVVHEAKRVLLDSVGCAVGGLDTDKGRAAVAVARRLSGPGESSILGTALKVSAAAAAFANGETMNALDFDAILRPAVHVTPWVLTPALALGEGRSGSGAQLLLSIVLGHELGNRMARALPVREDVSGYSFNAFGAAAGAAGILGLGPRGLAEAMAIAGYNAPMPSYTQWERSGTSALIKYGSPGWVAMGGVVAALLAQEGYSGDLSVLDSEDGFWKYSGAREWRPEALLDGLGRDWQILGVRYKRYPCCGITHSALDAFTELLDEQQLAAEELDGVTVWMDPRAALPLWRDRQISDEVKAQFSVPYDFAVAAHRLALNWDWLRPETRQDPRIHRFMSKVSVHAHPRFDEAAREDPACQLARVEIRARGTTYVRETRYASGRASPERPAPPDRQLEEKFQRNVSGRLPDQRAREFIERVWTIEEAEEVTSLIALLNPQGPRDAGQFSR
jgi:2-methylcitrate dehydratase PrpD